MFIPQGQGLDEKRRSRRRPARCHISNILNTGNYILKTMSNFGKVVEKNSTYPDSHTISRNQHDIVEKQSIISVEDDLEQGRISPPKLGSRARSIQDEESHRPSASANEPVIKNIRRRGFLSKYVLIPEVDNPMEYPNRTKWTITAVISLASSLAPLGSSIIFRK